MQQTRCVHFDAGEKHKVEFWLHLLEGEFKGLSKLGTTGSVTMYGGYSMSRVYSEQ